MGENINFTTIDYQNQFVTNSSSVPGDCKRFPHYLAILSQVASFTVGILGLYTTVALSLHLYFGQNTKSPQKKPRKLSGAIDHRRRGRIYKRLMNLNMIFAAAFITIRSALDFGLFQSNHIRNPYYETISRIEILLNIAALSCMYFVLWLRQWSFYNHPCLGSGKLGKLRVICVLLFIVMVATGIWNAFAFLIDRSVVIDSNDCIWSNSSNGEAMTKFYSLGACTLFYQAVLLGLFAYPLASHSKRSLQNESSKKRSIFRVLQRVFIAAIICCITDIIASIISVVLEMSIPESSFFIYNLNLVVNFLSLMYTFSDCKLRLLYPFIMCKRTTPANWAATTTVNSMETSNF